MGNKPAKEEPKYKLQILKMEIIPAQVASPDVRVKAKKPVKPAKK